VALQALMNLRPAEQPPLAVFPDCTRGYWVDMWSAHRIPQLHFQLSKPDRYFFIQVTTQSLQDRFFFQIMNYQGFQNKQVNLYELFFFGT
jgi:hypothetical protein